METLIIVRDIVGATPYWASGKTLPEVRMHFKKLTTHVPSKKASIVAFTGTPEDIHKIVVNDLGDIIYEKTTTKIILQ